MIATRYFKHWRWALSLLFGFAVFASCLWPLRPLLNYHEQLHLFRWTTAYLREQASMPGGCMELGISFFTQFFYVGWLGALVVAFLCVALQGLCWVLLRAFRAHQSWGYPLSFVPSLLLFSLVLVPAPYRSEASFRQSVLYDYLVRRGDWAAILRQATSKPPLTDHALWCANFALAMHGRLTEDLFTLEQRSPDALLLDTRHSEILPLFSLSDIFFQLGLVNDAERLAFEAKQYLPANQKSGRLFRRLAEVNLINGDSAIAAKYSRILQSSLFYRARAKRYSAVLRGELSLDSIHYYSQRQRYRLKHTDQLSPSLALRLEALMHECPENRLARDYCEAYDLLCCDYNRVLADELWIQQQETRQTPRAVQECIVGNWILLHPNDTFPVSVNQNVLDQTVAFFQTAEHTRDMLHPSLCRPPHSQTYWHYYALSLQRRKK